jgi:hypothetical protein
VPPTGTDGAVPSRPSSPPATILGSLDLHRALVSGQWQWKDAITGGTLMHARVLPGKALLVSLPVRPQGRAYKLSFDLLLQTPQSDAGVILPVGGDARTGLVLNLNATSGLGLVQGARWDYNSTTVKEPLPAGQPLHFIVKVGPYGDRATIMVEVDNRPFIRWEGARRDLSLFADPKLGWTLPDREVLGFASYGGGLEISDVAIEFLAR